MFFKNVTDVTETGERNAACNVVQHDQNGGEFVMVWGYDAWRECIQAHVYKLLSTIELLELNFTKMN